MVKSSLTFHSSSHARRLKAAAGVERLILMTDAVRLPDPAAAIASLPAGSIVIFRDYDHPDRAGLGRQLKRVCRVAGCWFLLAGDIALARQLRADGVHLPEYMLADKPKGLQTFSLITAACHSVPALRRAERAGVSLAIVSPVFPTESHPGAKTLGVPGLTRLQVRTKLPVAALGGVSMKNARQLRPLRLAAIAGISGITG